MEARNQVEAIEPKEEIKKKAIEPNKKARGEIVSRLKMCRKLRSLPCGVQRRGKYPEIKQSDNLAGNVMVSFCKNRPRYGCLNEIWLATKKLTAWYWNLQGNDLWIYPTGKKKYSAGAWGFSRLAWVAGTQQRLAQEEEEEEESLVLLFFLW